ncbi:hypothetical protein [Rugosimonospora africana]|uniref:Uncharacterized protein n=1 Tax=Rugosimonospora africana TaxID=556532 RepID=A0A8J3R1K0_9ACTN|nr:hypothetical protein [Rugosimonospora africana]GIH21379.1 hypothetical protein Raf01_95510 [Rugosimonospora africana]
MTWLPDGAGNVQLLLVVGIATVLVTRACLAALGYPQVGNGSLHIAHALWGGLLLLVGVVTTLSFAGHAARRAAAVLAGVGCGLFIDEVGKFITRNNDYFFRPAAAVIYVFFALLAFLSARYRAWNTRQSAAAGTLQPDDLSDAAVIAGAGLANGLTSDERARVARLLADRESEEAHLIQRLVDLAPDRTAPSPLRSVMRTGSAAARRLADRSWVAVGLIVLFALSRSAAASAFLGQAAWVLAGHHLHPGQEQGAIFASTVSRTVEAVLAITGALRWRHRRRSAIGYLMAALYIDLFVTQLFNFTDSQLGALVELPFLLLILLFLAHHRRASSALPS